MCLLTLFLTGADIKAQEPLKEPKIPISLGCYPNDKRFKAEMMKDSRTEKVDLKNGYVLRFRSRSANVLHDRLDFKRVPCEGHPGWVEYRVEEKYLTSTPLREGPK